MRASRWRRSLVVVATVGLIGFGSAGCTSDADPPEPAPLPTASPSPTLSSSATAPTLPPEAEGTSAKAAKAFARFWIAAMNHAATTGETSPAKAIAASTCDSCTAMTDKIDKVYEAGGSFEGDGWTVRNLRYEPFQPERRPILTVGISVARQKLTEAAGAEPTTFPPGRNQLTMRLEWRRDHWLLNQLDRLS